MLLFFALFFGVYQELRQHVPYCVAVVLRIRYVRPRMLEQEGRRRILAKTSTLEKGGIAIDIRDFNLRASRKQAQHTAQVSVSSCNDQCRDAILRDVMDINAKLNKVSHHSMMTARGCE
jgi:hypothetical protein